MTRGKLIEQIKLFVFQVSCILDTEIKGIDFNNCKTARYRSKTKRITIPIVYINILESFEGWLKWLLIHEVCHCVDIKHSPIFKKVEDEICQLYDIELIRKKAYPRYIYCKRDQMEWGAK